MMSIKDMGYRERREYVETSMVMGLISERLDEIGDEMLDYVWDVRDNHNDDYWRDTIYYYMSMMDSWDDDCLSSDITDDYEARDVIDYCIDDMFDCIVDYFFDGLDALEMYDGPGSYGIYHKRVGSMSYSDKVSRLSCIEAVCDYFFDGAFEDFIGMLRDKYCPICNHKLDDWDGDTGDCPICGYTLGVDDGLDCDASYPFDGSEWDCNPYPLAVYGDSPRDDYPWIYDDAYGMRDKYPALREYDEWLDDVESTSSERVA